MNFKIFDLIKENIVFLCSMATFVTIHILYIDRGYTDVYFLDGLLQVPNIEKYYEGTLTLKDIFKPFGEHRLAGYSIIFLLNTIYFGLNLKIEPLIFLITYSIIGIILYFQYKRFLISNLKRDFKFGVQFSYIIILVSVFSLTHPPLMLMSTQFVVGTLFFLMSAIYFNQMCLENVRWYVFTLFLFFSGMYVIVFSGAYFGGGFISLISCLLIKVLFSDYRKVNLLLFLSITFVTLLMTSIFFITNTGVSGGVTISEKLQLVFLHFSESIMSLLAGLSAITLDLHTLTEQLMDESFVPLINGGILFLLGIYSFYRYIRLKIFNTTYLPLMLMMYSLGIIFIVHLGRLSGGWRWPMNEWYSFHYYFYVVGVLWILFYDIFKRIDVGAQGSAKGKKLGVSFSIIMIGYITCSQLYSSHHQWDRAKDVKGWLENKRLAILSPNAESLESLYLPHDESLNAIRILKKYKLSSFREHFKVLDELKRSSGNDLHSAKTISGWYSWEGSIMWMAKESEAYFHTKKSGKMNLKGFVEKVNLPNKISILLDDKEVYRSDISEPLVDIEISEVPVDSVVNLKIILDHAIVPAQAGTGGDLRELGMAVSSIEF
jgi:hypothetical protein